MKDVSWRLDLIRESHLRVRIRQKERILQRELVKALALALLRRSPADPSAPVH